METYSLNPHILPGKPLSEHDHKKVRATLIVAILIAAAIGVAYWLSIAHRQAEVTTALDQQAQLRSRVAALLKDTPVQTSQADIDTMTSLLTQLKVASSEQDKQNMANALKN